MNVIKKIIVTLIVLVVIVVVAAAVAISTVDINSYRTQIAGKLSQQIGRTVAFNGPIKLDVSMHGVGLDIQNASIGNPSWASRPQMASIQKLDLGVALMPLIRRQFVVTALNVDNADIQLETNANGQNNWTMGPAGPDGHTAQAAAAPTSGNPVGVSVEELSVTNSKITMRDKDGKISTFKVDKVTMDPSGKGMAITASADYNGTPIKLDMKTGSTDIMGNAKWPFTAALAYANYNLKAQGTADTGDKSVELASYDLSAGGSSLHGQLTANFGGARGKISGSVTGDKFDPADFKPPASNDEAAQTAPAKEEPVSQSKQLFSTAPLDVSALKSVNADIDVSIGEMTVGKATLKQIGGKLELADGNLAISPFKAMLGDSELTGDIKLETAATPQYSISFKAPGVDIASLLSLGGAEAFLSGKGDMDIQLSGSGDSLHNMASTTNGHIDITAAGGSISASAAGGIAAGLAQIFAPGNSSPALNCLAARFVVTGGVGKDNGILADSSASTVAGSGGFNLGNETVDLTLRAKPKMVSTGGITPAVKITGPLASPQIGLDTAGAIQNVAGILLKNKLGGLGGNNVAGSSSDGGVPAMATAPAGENACIYTLDHKAATAASTPKNSAIKDVTGQAASKAKGLGNQLMKGLLGH